MPRRIEGRVCLALLYVYLPRLEGARATPTPALARNGSLPPCVVNGSWAGACEWPSSPPPDCPFPHSTFLTGVTFSGRFGSYPTTAADTWYSSPRADGTLFSAFADGRVCTSAPPSPPPPPPDLMPLVWWWSETLSDNVLTTDAMPPQPVSSYTRVGVIAYGITLLPPSPSPLSSNAPSLPPGGSELILWHGVMGGGGRDGEYWTTSTSTEEAAARAANYTLIAHLGAYLPPPTSPQPPPYARHLPPTSNHDMPPGEDTQAWVPMSLLFNEGRGDHYSSPESVTPSGYVFVNAQGFALINPAASGNACASASGVSATQGWATLSGDAYNLSISFVGTVPHPPIKQKLSVPPPYGVYPSTVLAFGTHLWYGYYLLAETKGCNWCYLGPLLGFASSSDEGVSWSYDQVPLRDGSGDARGVFEPLNVSAPIRMGVPRFADLGPDLIHSPDGRAYLIAKGCSSNDGMYCSFMTGDSAYLARTREPLAHLLSSANASVLNDAAVWEFHYAAGVWVPTLDAAQPLFSWPTGVGGLTLTYNPPLARYLIVVNLPGDRIHSGTCTFDTYILESAAIDGPYSLVSFLTALGPQMYFQQLSSVYWSQDGLTGTLFSSGNWDGKCKNQGSNPPGERYGLVTTEVAFVRGSS